MIVQTAPAGAPRFVMTMKEHCAFAGQAARAFGNAEFEPVAPREEMLYLVDNHDRGWFAIDEAPGRNPETGLPWNLTETPRAISIRTLNGSPDALEAHHPYCGLLAAMHMYGVYRGRFGLSQRQLIENVPAEWRARFDAELDRLAERQAAMKTALADDPATAAWVAPDRLMQSYKQLQFFDTLALYFNLTGASERGPAAFPCVPRSATGDVTVRVTPLDAETYAFDPFPFRAEGVQLILAGRSMRPVDGDDAALAAALRSTPASTQKISVVSAA
jgi:hypothetical protein